MPGTLDVTVQTDMTVAAAASVLSDGKGHPGGQGPGAGPNGYYYGSGAGYGGVGGSGDNGGGGVYGSEAHPLDSGSGGGGSIFWGGTGAAGGGVVQLVVIGTLTIDGTLSANGADASHYSKGGGSGGSILVNAGTLAGTGIIRANGGAGGANAGGGGGGRIAIYTCDRQVEDSHLTASGGGGAHAGQPGTLWYGPGAIAVQPVAQYTTHPGGSAVLSVLVATTGQLSYQWRKDGENLADDGRISGATTSTMTIQPTEWADAGTYDVIVTGICASPDPVASAPAVLSLRPDFDADADVDQDDLTLFHACATGPEIPGPPEGCTPAQFVIADIDGDHDVDQTDFGLWQRAYTGPGPQP